MDLNDTLIFEQYFEKHPHPIYQEYLKGNFSKKIGIINSNQEMRNIYRAYNIMLIVTNADNLDYFYQIMDHKQFIEGYCIIVISICNREYFPGKDLLRQYGAVAICSEMPYLKLLYTLH